MLDCHELSILREGAGQPCTRIADRRAELENALRSDGAREDMEETPFCSADDGPAFGLPLALDGLQRGIASVREAIDVFVISS